MRSAAHHPIARLGTDANHRVTYVGHPHRLGWRGVAARAATALLVGVGTLVMPELSIAVLLALVGGYTLVSAGAALGAARDLTRRGEPAWLFLAYGLAAAVVAAVLLWWPGAVTAAVIGVLAVWMALGGAAELLLAAQLRRRMPHAWLLGAVGALSLVAAGVLAAHPQWAAATETRVIGVYALLSGLFLSGFAARLRHEQHTLREPVR